MLIVGDAIICHINIQKPPAACTHARTHTRTHTRAHLDVLNTCSENSCKDLGYLRANRNRNTTLCDRRSNKGPRSALEMPFTVIRQCWATYSRQQIVIEKLVVLEILHICTYVYTFKCVTAFMWKYYIIGMYVCSSL